MSGTLFIVATPIGNLEDMGQRAWRVLREVDLIACEDTRHTQKLLNRLSFNNRTISYHEHNERERADELIEMLEAGKNIALVSDAGTPLISDPGFRVVNSAVQRGINIVPIPGPSALVTALSASGLPTDQFFFAGFLPARATARRAKLEELRMIPATLIFYEAPRRIASALRDAADVLGNRQAAVARELTKLHEDILRGSLSELAEQLASQPVKGEIVLIIGAGKAEFAAASDGRSPSQRLSERARELEQQGIEPKEALKLAARELGIKRAEAYRMMVAQKKRRNK